MYNLNKIKTKSKKLLVGDTVKAISLSSKSEKWIKYYNFDLIGKTGKVIEILGTKVDPHQGVRVKFPFMWIDGTDEKKLVYGFEWSFYNGEVKKINEKIEFKEKKKRHILKGKALKIRKATVRRLRKEGESIENLAKRFDVNRTTIWRWISELK